MKPGTLAKAVKLAGQKGYVFIATADNLGKTHLAAARTISIRPGNKISVSDWFCPQTMENLQTNNSLSIVAWDEKSDAGFQILGEVEAINDLAMLNGYSPDQTGKQSIPQVNRELLIKVDRIVDFKIAPHSDLEE